ncbi:MAG: helix-turn-helix domain-containing protein [Verrucomicrobiales bacterium]
MNATENADAAALLSLEQVCRLVQHPGRWAVLRILAAGEPLPVSEIARRMGVRREMAAKHLQLMRRLGVAQVGYGHLYSLAPAFRPEPGSGTLDLGHCVLRLGG